MKPFFTGPRLWRPGFRSVQTYLVPDLDANPELRALTDCYGRVLQDFSAPVSAPTPRRSNRRWVHRVDDSRQMLFMGTDFGFQGVDAVPEQA